MPDLPPLQPLLLGLSVALGAGLLIGLERERRKGHGPRRAAAGIRSFTLAALAGGLGQGLGAPLLVAVGALAIVVLAALAYAHSLRLPPLWSPAPPPDPTHPTAATDTAAATHPAHTARGAANDPQGTAPPDPGMTTELALLVTYLVGVLAVEQPALGAGAAAVVAALLAARGRLHRFATQVLSEEELHDGLLLAALALVLMPLVPQQPVAWLGGVQPRQLAALVLLILLLQAAGHVALRWLGPGTGLALSGLLSGFVSSTATIAAMGGRARAEPAHATACRAGAVLSTGATWLQAALMLVTLAPALAWRLWPALAAGACSALAIGAALAWRARPAALQAATVAATARAQGRGPSGTSAPATATAPTPDRAVAHRPAGRPLRVREALLLAAVLTGVTLVVSAASRWAGDRGALAGAIVAALGDAHSGVTALAALAASGRMALPLAAWGVLATVGSNSLSRSVVAWVAGGPRHATAVGLSLLVSSGAAVAALWLVAAMGAPT